MTIPEQLNKIAEEICDSYCKYPDLVKDKFEMRRMIADSIAMKTYLPQDTMAWDAAYENYLKLTN